MAIKLKKFLKEEEINPYQRKDGSYMYRYPIDVDDEPEGTKDYKDSYGNTKEKVIRKVLDFQAGLMAGEVKTKTQIVKDKKENLTVMEACRIWMIEQIFGNLEEKTIGDYASVIRNHIDKHLGNKKYVDLEMIDILSMLQELKQKGVKKRTDKGPVGVLKQVLDYMQERDGLYCIRSNIEKETKTM